MKTKNFYGNTALIAGATFLSRILGLAREQLFAYLFGASMVSDAFQIAFRIPNLLRDLLAEGSMSSALVPVYTRVRKEQGEAAAWSLVNNAISVLLAIVLVITALGICFAEPLVRLYAPAFAEVPEKFLLTVTLTKMLWPFFPCVVLAAVWMGVLNARSRFAVPAFASSVFNLTSIFLAVVFCFSFLRFWHWPPIYSMAFAILLGGLMQWLIQIPVLRREGFRFRFFVNFRDKGLREILWLMGAGTFGLAGTQINILVNSMLAAGQGTGAVSWLHYAFRLLQFPIGVFGVAIATTTLTKVSEEYKDNAALRTSIVDALRMLLILSVPSAVGLAFLSRPIIAVIYEHGHFTTNDTAATARALVAYSLGLSAYAGVKVLLPIFYSIGHSKPAIAMSGLFVGLNAALCYALSHVLGFVGLPLATSISTILNAALLLGFLNFYIGALNFKDLWSCFWRVGVSSLLMALVLCFCLNLVGLSVFGPISLTSYWLGAKFPVRLVFLSAAIVTGAATYIICARVLGIREILRWKEFYGTK